MNNKPNDGGPAFPFTGCGADGMTLRDYFAAKAMQAMITGKSSSSYKQTSSNAYEIADAMLLAREVKK
jgi:hypothetical protein